MINKKTAMSTKFGVIELLTPHCYRAPTLKYARVLSVAFIIASSKIARSTFNWVQLVTVLLVGNTQYSICVCGDWFPI